MITALRTAQRSGRNTKIHSLPEAGGEITMCGLDMAGAWIGNGYHNIETEVTCRNCERVMLANPEIIIVIEVSEETGYAPADHSECDHHDNPCEDCSDCRTGTTCEACAHGRCECASVANSECDSVVGRYLDGDIRCLSHKTDVIDYDRGLWFDVMSEGLDYHLTRAGYLTRALTGSALSSHRGLDWHPDGLPMTFERESYMNACRSEYYDSEIHFEHTLRITGAGVTPKLREFLFKTL